MTDGVLYLSVHLFDCRLINERADTVRRIHAVTRLHAAHAGLQGLKERIKDTSLHEYPIRADASLTGVEKLHQRHPFGGMHRIGIVIDDEGRVTAELHRYPLELGRAGLCQMLAHCGGACKRQFADRGVSAEHFADGLWVARRDQIGNARRQAGLLKNLEDGDGAEWRAFGGL